MQLGSGDPLLWGGFLLLVFLLLALDLGVFHRKAHAITSKEAGIWTVVWIGLALALASLIVPHFRVGASATQARSASEGSTWAGSASVASAHPFDSLAIVPLTNVTDDPKGEPLCEGIAEQVSSNMSQLRQIKVRPITSTARYRGQNVDDRGRRRGMERHAAGVGAPHDAARDDRGRGHADGRHEGAQDALGVERFQRDLQHQRDTEKGRDQGAQHQGCQRRARDQPHRHRDEGGIGVEDEGGQADRDELEGAVIGAGVTLGAVLTLQWMPRARTWHKVLGAALDAMCAGILVTVIGGNLFSGSLEIVARSFADSQMRMDPLAPFFGEVHFGQTTQIIFGAIEGLLFGAGMSAGIEMFSRAYDKTRGDRISTFE